ELAERNRNIPTADRWRVDANHLAGHLDETEPRVDTADRPDVETSGRDVEREVLLVGTGHDPRAPPEPVDPQTLPVEVTRRVPSTDGGEHDATVEAEAGRQQPLERGGRRVGRALALEQDRHRGPLVGRQRVQPPELVEGGVER